MCEWKESKSGKRTIEIENVTSGKTHGVKGEKNDCSVDQRKKKEKEKKVRCGVNGTWDTSLSLPRARHS